MPRVERSESGKLLLSVTCIKNCFHSFLLNIDLLSLHHCIGFVWETTFWIISRSDKIALLCGFLLLIESGPQLGFEHRVLWLSELSCGCSGKQVVGVSVVDPPTQKKSPPDPPCAAPCRRACCGVWGLGLPRWSAWGLVVVQKGSVLILPYRGGWGCL